MSDAYSWVPNMTSNLASALGNVSMHMLEANRADKMIREERVNKHEVVSEAFKLVDLISSDRDLSSQIATKYNIDQSDPEFTTKVNNVLKGKFNFDPNNNKEGVKEISGMVLNGLQSIAADVDFKQVQAIALKMNEVNLNEPVDSKLWFQELSTIKQKEAATKIQNSGSFTSQDEYNKKLTENGLQTDETSEFSKNLRYVDRVKTIANLYSGNRKMFADTDLAGSVTLLSQLAPDMTAEDLQIANEYIADDRRNQQYLYNLRNAESQLATEAAQRGLIAAQTRKTEQDRVNSIALTKSATTENYAQANAANRSNIGGDKTEPPVGIMKQDDFISQYLDPAKKALAALTEGKKPNEIAAIKKSEEYRVAVASVKRFETIYSTTSKNGTVNIEDANDVKAGTSNVINHSTYVEMFTNKKGVKVAEALKVNRGVKVISYGDDYVVFEDRGLAWKVSKNGSEKYELPKANVGTGVPAWNGAPAVNQFDATTNVKKNALDDFWK